MGGPGGKASAVAAVKAMRAITIARTSINLFMFFMFHPLPSVSVHMAVAVTSVGPVSALQAATNIAAPIKKGVILIRLSSLGLGIEPAFLLDPVVGDRRPAVVRGGAAPGEEDPGVACLRWALLGLLTDRA